MRYETKGSRLLRSTQTAVYNDKVHTGVWAEARESLPKDYDVLKTDTKTKNMHRSTYDHFSNLVTDYKTSYQVQNESLQQHKSAKKTVPQQVCSLLQTKMSSVPEHSETRSPKWRTIYESDYLFNGAMKPLEPRFPHDNKDFKIKFSYFSDGFSAKRDGMQKFADCDGF
ncbi:hypothetical protein Ciccas_003893 [Cichlidogyrus casuarinus]|uniref:Uncharacterized protein n=1 Tax=Cichlidogyrus casuarinus TaxID=1844966 RepID=A0ABD2QD51_9PLAT